MFTLKGKVTPFYFKSVIDGEESTTFYKVEEIEPTYSIDDAKLIGIRVVNDPEYGHYFIDNFVTRMRLLENRRTTDSNYIECSEEEYNKNLEKVKQMLNLV